MQPETTSSDEFIDETEFADMPSHKQEQNEIENLEDDPENEEELALNEERINSLKDEDFDEVRKHLSQTKHTNKMKEFEFSFKFLFLCFQILKDQSKEIRALAKKDPLFLRRLVRRVTGGVRKVVRGAKRVVRKAVRHTQRLIRRIGKKLHGVVKSIGKGPKCISKSVFRFSCIYFMYQTFRLFSFSHSIFNSSTLLRHKCGLDNVAPLYKNYPLKITVNLNPFQEEAILVVSLEKSQRRLLISLNAPFPGWKILIIV